MRIEFVRDHGAYKAGAVVVHPSPGVADALVRRGIAKPAAKGKAADKKPKG